MHKLRSLTISEQAQSIRKNYGVNVQTNLGNSLTANMTIKSSPLGMEYEIKLTYSNSSTPKVYIINPKPLLRYGNEEKLPHCYDNLTQHLCLYYPDKNEWNRSLYISDTIIPWAMEWLFHYEIWVKTGVWTGGGVHRENKEIKNNKKLIL